VQPRAGLRAPRLGDPVSPSPGPGSYGRVDGDDPQEVVDGPVIDLRRPASRPRLRPGVASVGMIECVSRREGITRTHLPPGNHHGFLLSQTRYDLF
jgi:hypothetical protein